MIKIILYYSNEAKIFDNCKDYNIGENRILFFTDKNGKQISTSLPFVITADN